MPHIGQGRSDGNRTASFVSLVPDAILATRPMVAGAAREVIGMAESNSIADLPGLGPKSCEMLAQAGIASLEQLRALGSVAAYVRAKRANPRASLNLLWGLEAALSGTPWQEVARRHRASLLLALETYERQHGDSAPGTEY